MFLLKCSPVWEIAVHLAVACEVYDSVFLCCPFSPRDVLDEILNLIESISEGFSIDDGRSFQFCDLRYKFSFSLTVYSSVYSVSLILQYSVGSKIWNMFISKYLFTFLSARLIYLEID